LTAPHLIDTVTYQRYHKKKETILVTKCAIKVRNGDNCKVQ